MVLSRDLPWDITNWLVDESYNGSDHRTVRFRIEESIEEVKQRSWGSICWSRFTDELSKKVIYIPPKLDQRKLDKLLAKFYGAVNEALDKAGEYKNVRKRRKMNLWYTSELSALRKEVGKAHKQYIRNLSLIHISEPTRLGMISYAVFCLKKKK